MFDANVMLTVIGMLASLFVAVVTCTWWLARVIGSLIVELKDVSTSFTAHVEETNRSDRENADAHTGFRLTDQGILESIKLINHQLERISRDSGAALTLSTSLDKRLAVIESKRTSH